MKFAGRPSRKLTSRLAGIAEAAREIEGVVDASPGHTTVLIEVAPGSQQAVIAAVPEVIEHSVPFQGRSVEVALTYDGEDLEWSCNYLQMTLDELTELHSSRTYDVRLLGSPSFVYLSEVPKKLGLPRLERPRLEVPAGSVGIGGRQTGIYARSRPGGWRLIARAEDVPQLRPGDRVRFRPS